MRQQQETPHNPDLQTKLIALLTAAHEPVSVELLRKWLEENVDPSDPTIEEKIQEVLSSDDVRKIECGSTILYEIVSEKMATTIDRIGEDLREEARRTITRSGLKKYGRNKKS